MSLKPNDLAIGIVDFLSILVPGAVLSFGFANSIFRGISPRLTQLSDDMTLSLGIQDWIIFILISYILGQFLHLLGVSLIKPIYDKTYYKYRSKQLDPLNSIVKESLNSLFGDTSAPVRRAHAFVTLKSSEAAAELDRFEANSKLFRSLTLVFGALSIKSMLSIRWGMLALYLAAGLLSFWRYAERRWMQSVLTYEFFTILRLEPTSAINSNEKKEAVPLAKGV